jgi:hypothetical protein
MGTPHVDNYRFGHVVVDGQAHDRDLIILPERVVAGWWRKEGHNLHAEDLGAVFKVGPDLLIVGQGAYGRMRVSASAEAALQEAGVELMAMPTEDACHTYNRLREQRAVAAALHLTC